MKIFVPLRHVWRPQTIEQYIGQQHILGQDKPLRRALQAGHLHSMILWGPPGTGKTTLAEVAANYANAEVERVSAVTSGVKEIRAAIDRARKISASGGGRFFLSTRFIALINHSKMLFYRILKMER
ncbi:AAA family ATPase [Vibrio metschnikovii]